MESREVALWVGSLLGVPVIDGTALGGLWVFEAQYAGAPAPGSGASRGAADPALPTLRGALDEQLGLKLEPVRGPVEVLVIDSVQPPTEN